MVIQECGDVALYSASRVGEGGHVLNGSSVGRGVRASRLPLRPVGHAQLPFARLHSDQKLPTPRDEGVVEGAPDPLNPYMMSVYGE